MDELREALDTMNADELREEFIHIARDKAYLLGAGGKEHEWRAMSLLHSKLQELRKTVPGGEAGECINRARIALAEAATACLSVSDPVRAHQLVEIMNIVQKLIPHAWLEQFERDRLAKIKADSPANA